VGEPPPQLNTSLTEDILVSTRSSWFNTLALVVFGAFIVLALGYFVDRAMNPNPNPKPYNGGFHCSSCGALSLSKHDTCPYCHGPW
jgi:hypothetical protein